MVVEKVSQDEEILKYGYAQNQVFSGQLLKVLRFAFTGVLPQFFFESIAGFFL